MMMECSVLPGGCLSQALKDGELQRQRHRHPTPWPSQLFCRASSRCSTTNYSPSRPRFEHTDALGLVQEFLLCWSGE